MRGGLSLGVAAAVLAGCANSAAQAPELGLAPAAPSAQAPARTLNQVVAGMERRPGLADVYADRAGGRVLLLLPAPDAEGNRGRFIYHTALRTGLGSAQVPLDRAGIAGEQILRFRRIGKRIVGEFENPKYRATAASADEQAAGRDAFPTSLVWAGEIAAEAPDGRVMVDVSGLLTRDAFGIADRLKAAGQGTWRPVPELTLADPDMAKAFPENLELEARQTFTSDAPGAVANQIAPDARLLSFTVRHSFIKLPDGGYQPRAFDPRTGAISVLVTDFGAPLNAPVAQRLAVRFRLEKTDPTAARSTVKRPIVFYVDRAAPEPIRTALVEGARWWAQAFEAAGYIDAYRVEVLPESVDPLDARYNVINWVNRATRSWSYGQSVADPRSGEIVKGSVLLGSLRIRQDMLIFEGLVGADATGRGGPNDPQAVALARIRQLSAHEVGHAIGLLHNFAASTQDRASVMDYPVPRIAVRGEALDFSDAYATGVGAWDRFAIDWLYGDVPPGAAGQAALDAKARRGAAELRFVSDADARGAGDAHPWAGLWDNGGDPVAELAHVLAVRRIALSRFGPDSLPAGSPVAELRRRITPIYLFHRYQVDVAAKTVGGVRYTYAVKGDGRERADPVPPAEQRRALRALLATLSPAELALPEPLLALLSTANPGASDPQFDIELIRSRTGAVFDPGEAADTAAAVTLSALLAPERLNRLAAAEPGALTLDEMLGTLLDAVFQPTAASAREAELARRVQARTVLMLADARRNPRLAVSAAAGVDARLDALAVRLRATRTPGPQRAQDAYLAELLMDERKMTAALGPERRDAVVPPGSPIGADAEPCWHCEG